MKFAISALGFVAALATTSPVQAATLTFDLQPVALCENAVVCNAPDVDYGYLQTIYSQVDIVVNVLSTIFDTGLILDRNAGGEIIATETDINGFLTGGALRQFTDSFELASPSPFPVYDVDPNTIYMGFTGDLAPPTLGVAWEDSAFLPFGIVENTAGIFGGGDSAVRLTTAVLAHEIGHVLGGRHEDALAGTDLMRATINPAFFGDANNVPTFSAANSTEIRASLLLQAAPVAAVPLPASLPALLSGVFLLAGLRRRRTAAA